MFIVVYQELLSTFSLHLIVFVFFKFSVKILFYLFILPRYSLALIAYNVIYRTFNKWNI